MASNRALGALAGAGAVMAAWGLFEAQWVEGRELEVGVPGLPGALDGISVLHLSDFHAGTPSLNVRAVRKAAALGVAWQPDLVALTGDILSHGRSRDAVVRAMEELRPRLGTFAVLGNHDVGDTNDPFSRGIVIEDWGSAPVTLLRDEVAVIEADGYEIEIGGVDPALFAEGRNRPPEKLFTRPEAFRILLSHFPDVPAQMRPGTCSLALCGHLHGGQICLPTPRGKVRLSHRSYRYDEGVYEDPGTTVVVSRGLGTTLVPFRVMARPEVCLLRLRPR
ncbi:MAG TPA: metallophosphoesterase [Gaiellales bacterium]|nr:metallophosphoesterase [Gaiellales bacterium]